MRAAAQPNRQRPRPTCTPVLRRIRHEKDAEYAVRDDGRRVLVAGKTRISSSMWARKKRAQYPLLMLEGILTFSYKGASPALMGACAERGIGLTFLTPRGRFLARVCGSEARQCSAAPRAVSARRQPIRQLPDCTEFHLRQGIQSALGAGAYHPRPRLARECAGTQGCFRRVSRQTAAN